MPFKKGNVPHNKGKKGFKHTEESKKKIKKNNSRYWYGKKRSKETVKKIVESLTGKIGEDSRNWKGGKDLENKRVRSSLEYEIWRKEVYRKDNWTCRICSIKCRKGNIVAHHLKLFSDFPELRFSVDNGIVLCRSCHAKIHKNIKI